MLKKLISYSRRLASLKNDTHRLIYTWLIAHLDIEGRFHADSTIIKGSVVPRLKHITEKIIDQAILDMAQNELIFLYQEDGDKYLELRKFEDHQYLRKEREAPSKIPPITEKNQLPINAGVNPAQIKLREVKRREYSTRVNPDFEIFWESYPRKVNKKEARDKWNKAILPSLSFVLSALEKQKNNEQWKRDNGKYIPYPSTWINKERWNDEIITPNLKPLNNSGRVITKEYICHNCHKVFSVYEQYLQHQCSLSKQKGKEE